MGQVWLAKHESLGGEFAIKLVEPADDIEAETTAGRFQLEAQIAAKLSRRTRHIVSVSDHGEENGLAYLVMELLEGESLEARMRRVGTLEIPEVAAIVSQVARALTLAHEEGVFHRDLKPANMWLGRDEDGRLLVKLLDFGIARSAKPFRTRSPFATSKDMVLGTPSYMSPEQARGLDSLDYRCDLWALAVVAYEALTQKIPFEGETVEDIFLSICTFRVVSVLQRRPDLPSELEAFFVRAFAPKVDDRFSSAAELAEAFERFVSPEDFEAALGIPVVPTSGRRLEAVRGSRPSFNGIASGGSSQMVASPSPSFESLPNPRGSAHDFQNVAVGSPTVITRKSEKSGAVTWFVALVGLLGVLGVGLLLLVALRSANRTKVASQPFETSALASSELSSASAPATLVTTSVEDPPPENTAQAERSATQPDERAVTANDDPERSTTKKSVSSSTLTTRSEGTKTAPVVAPKASPPASPSTAPTAPVKTPSPAKTVNKGEVF